MFVAFPHLPPHARIWVYQASRPLTEREIADLLPQLASFADDWTSHGRQLLASAELLHRQFLVIGLDETAAGASGCSIDGSVRFVQRLGAQLGVDFLEKSRMAFLVNGEVKLLGRAELRAAIAAREIGPNTLYFNNTVGTKRDLDENWLAPASQTWLERYFAE